MEQKDGTYLAPDAAELEKRKAGFERQNRAFVAWIKERDRRREDIDGWILEKYVPLARNIIREVESGEASKDALHQEATARQFLLELGDYERAKAEGDENVARYYACKMAVVSEQFTTEGFYNRLGRGAVRGQINSAKARREKEGDNLHIISERTVTALAVKLGRLPQWAHTLDNLRTYDDEEKIIDEITDTHICWNDGPDKLIARETAIPTWRNRLTDIRAKVRKKLAEK